MSMIYDDYPSNYEGGISIGGYPVGGRARMHQVRKSGGMPVGGRARMHRKRGGMPVGGEFNEKAKKGMEDYKKNIMMLDKIVDRPANAYRYIVASLKQQLGKKPTQAQVKAFITKHKKNLSTIDFETEGKRAKKVKGKFTKEERKVHGKNITLKALKPRIKKLTEKEKYQLAEWLSEKGAGSSDYCPVCEGSGILSGLLSSFGLGADMEGSGWADDLWSGVKQGVDIGTKILPFVL